MARQQRSGKAEGVAVSARETKRKTSTGGTSSAKKATKSTRTTAGAGQSDARPAAKGAKPGRTATKPARPATKPGTATRKSMPTHAVSGNIEPTFEQVSKRAYEIYLGRGSAPGDAMSDWLQAERELRQSNGASGTHPASAKRGARS